MKHFFRESSSEIKGALTTDDFRQRRGYISHHIRHIRGFTAMRSINLRFTYFLTKTRYVVTCIHEIFHLVTCFPCVKGNIFVGTVTGNG